MGAKKPLEGLAILVTRPERQAENLCALIERDGGKAVRFPTLEIRGLTSAESLFSDPGKLGRFDWLVFISANAVYFALKACNNALFIARHTKVAAIGEATSAALTRRGIPVDLVPHNRFDSEAILASPEMQTVAGLSILIVRGRGGREMLADTLRSRGAQVRYAEVYERFRPASVEIDRHLRDWLSIGIDAVTISSGESLLNLVALLGDNGMAWARQVPLVVPGARVAVQAEQHGFMHVVLAAGAADRALFEALVRFSDPDRLQGLGPVSAN